MKKKHNLSNQSESKQTVAKLPLPLKACAYLPALKDEIATDEKEGAAKLEHMQTAQSLTEAVLATLSNDKAVPADRTDTKQSLSRLESLALAEALNYRKGTNTTSPSVAIYEQEQVDKAALPNLLIMAERKIQLDKLKKSSQKGENAANLLATEQIGDKDIPLQVQPESQSVSQPELQPESQSVLQSVSQSEQPEQSKQPELQVKSQSIAEQPLDYKPQARKLESKVPPKLAPSRIFSAANQEDLIFSYEEKQRQFTYKRNKKVWSRSIIGMFKTWHSLLLPKKQVGDWQENNIRNAATINTVTSKTRANLATSYLLTTSLFMLLAYFAWTLLPGSFLTVYKTQVSGYVLKTLYRDSLCFALPAYLLVRRYKLKQTFFNKLVGFNKLQVVSMFIIPLLALSIACLLTACNRLLVIHLFAKQRVEILEAPFLILNASNRQSFILLFACSVVLSSIVETICLCGLYMTALKVRFQAKLAILLCALVWPLLYVSEVDFISLFIFSFLLAYFRQISDNIYWVVVLNIMVKASLLLERWLLPSMVQRNSVSYSASQAMTLVDILLIVVCTFLIYYLSQLCKKLTTKPDELSKKADFYKKTAKILVHLQMDKLSEHWHVAASTWPLAVAYLILIANYALRWCWS